MVSHSSGGCYYLRRGVRLIPASGGGILLQENPLRALKINPAAFDILKRCEHGFRPESTPPFPAARETQEFLELLRLSCILDWSPPIVDSYPSVSVIIPVYNRSAEIAECLASLQALDYPQHCLEIIVVDDASRDDTAAVVRRFGVHLIIQSFNQGQSAARNVGAAAARGDILAFIDSDCIAGPRWLKELVPYFQNSEMALVGGGVDTFSRENRLDRYEAANSALSMGSTFLLGRGRHSSFYVPTCNMLVRKEVYRSADGLDESLRVGEDVDFCWRLMARGNQLAYVPEGKVRHKHRNRFFSTFPRRFEYGTSEAVLYKRYPLITKYFPLQIGGLAMILALAGALVTGSPKPVIVAACLIALETFFKQYQLKQKMAVSLGWIEIAKAVIKSHLKLTYYLAFFALRYFLLLIISLSLAFPSLLPLWLAVVLIPTGVDYIRKKPELSFPEFAFFYWSEHSFYQSGAFWGSLKEKSFRLYRISFCPVGFLQNTFKRKRSPDAAEQNTFA
ncbi:MAG: mycofactocin biosynthesis glycosyltransferase MftF [Pseudomonadota bacterium]